MLFKLLFVITVISFFNYTDVLLVNHVLFTQIFIIIFLFLFVKNNAALSIDFKSLLCYVIVIYYICSIYWQNTSASVYLNFSFFNLICIKLVSTFF